MFEIKKAKRQRRPLKISMEGLSGQGKTYTALRLAFDMRRHGIGNKIVVLDSENESAGLYAGTREDGETWDYDTVDMPHERRNPLGYTEAYEYLVTAGYDIIIVDSLSHAWHGALEAVDAHARQNRNDKFGAWANVTPQQRAMIEALTDNRAHCISTMRVKADFQDQEVNGRTKKVKVGLKADQRDGTEYEYDLVLRFEAGNECVVEKVRGCSAINNKGAVKPGPSFWKPLFDWWLTGEVVVSPEEAARAKLKAATTLDELRDAYSALSRPLQVALAELKDERKAALSAPKPAYDAPEVDEHGNPILFDNAAPATNLPG